MAIMWSHLFNKLTAPSMAVFLLLILTTSIASTCTATDSPVCNHAEVPQDQKRPPPNILFVLIDDLGWGDVGFHMQQDETNNDQKNTRRRTEVQTPVMDRLVEEGLELNRHYVHHSCTGTRTSLQSGRFPVHVQTTLKNPEVPSSGMPRNLTGLGEMMKKNNTNGTPYATHYVGKWDVGMATPKHTPHGRGYDSSLSYFEHKNDYFTQKCLQSACCKVHYRLDQPDEDDDDDKPTIYDLWDTDKPARDLVETDYEEFIFQNRMFDIIDHHADSQKSKDATEQQPLFLFYAPHVAHCPLQVPQHILDQFDFMDEEGYDDGDACCTFKTYSIVEPDKKQPKCSCRKQYHAMVKLLDDILGSLVDRFKKHDMWENTLLVLTSDNGGPIDPEESASTNFPLRGGKYSDWEGGVRATAFVSGGYLPENRRGQILQKSIHITDWYATLPALAGVDVLEHQNDDDLMVDKRVPPVDAVDVWPLIMGDYDDDGCHSIAATNEANADGSLQGTPPRNEIPLSEYALIVGDYKLQWREDKNINMAGWTYPDYPNSHTKGKEEIYGQHINCTAGCLFNVATDPGEHNDIAKSEPLRVQAMKKRLEELRKGFYDNDETGIDSCPKGYNDDDNSLLCACWMATNYYGGFMGPYQEVELLPHFLEMSKVKNQK